MFYAELDAPRGRCDIDGLGVRRTDHLYRQAALQRDIDNFKAALGKAKVTEAFMPVAAPASVIPDRKNEFYKTEEDLIRAIGERCAPSTA